MDSNSTNLATNKSNRCGISQRRSPAVSNIRTDERFHRTVSICQDGTPEATHKGAGMLSFGRIKLNEDFREKEFNSARCSLGLYRNHPLANSILANSCIREKSLKQSGSKQLNHVRGTDGWWRSMLVLEVRAIDKYFNAWCVIVFNAFIATVLHETFGISMLHDTVEQWDAVYSLVLKTSLAFLLVFRLNRNAMRFWETRTMWGNITHNTRNLVAGILNYGRHQPTYRDEAVKWASAYCVATMHFIRSEYTIPKEELAGFLSRQELDKMQDANHQPLYAATMVRYYLRKIFQVNKSTPPALAYAYATQQNNLEQLIQSLVTQTSGMERVRSTPLPIVYVSHLRTFLFAYCAFLPYIWVTEWHWLTVPLVAFTAFALLGIEGSSSECEIPFDRNRPNHLAMDGYCLVILDAVQGLVVHDANLDMQECLHEDYESTIEEGNEEEVNAVYGNYDECGDEATIEV